MAQSHGIIWEVIVVVSDVDEILDANGIVEIRDSLVRKGRKPGSTAPLYTFSSFKYLPFLVVAAAV